MILDELKNLYKYRYVCFAFVTTNLKQKYRRSVLGYLWSLLSPILQYGLLSWIFSYTMKSNINNYFVYTFFGALTYNIFSACFTQATNIMIANEHYIKKIYIPKSVFVMNVVLYEITNFILSFIGLFILGLALGKIQLSLSLFFLPVSLILIAFFIAGVVSIISVLSVFFRDIVFIMPVIMQAFLFITPIYYQSEHGPKILEKYLKFNPFQKYIDLIREPLWALHLPSFYTVVGTTCSSAIMFLIGISILRKYDNKIVFKL